MEFSRLLAQRNEQEKVQADTATVDLRAEQIAGELTSTEPAITAFDNVAVRQLIESVKVLSKEKLLVRFKDGTEIEQMIK